MLPLEHFEENRKINRMLETINNIVRGAVLAEDKDEQTIGFYQDLISNLISLFLWDLIPKTIGSLIITYLAGFSFKIKFSIVDLNLPYLLFDKVLSYSYEGKCSKASKTLDEEINIILQLFFFTYSITDSWVLIWKEKGPLRQEIIKFGFTLIIILFMSDEVIS